jgi:hypothetical protein
MAHQHGVEMERTASAEAGAAPVRIMVGFPSGYNYKNFGDRVRLGTRLLLMEDGCFVRKLHKMYILQKMHFVLASLHA